MKQRHLQVCFSISVLVSTFFLSDLYATFPIDPVNVDTGQMADTFAFYYPWYGTPMVSGYWFHWDNTEHPVHNPNNIVNGLRDIAAVHYPFIDVYDSNDANVIRAHISMAKAALIDGFVASWWGINSFEDRALSHIQTVCEEQDFLFTIYYEDTLTVVDTVADILYLLTNYAVSENWYRIEGRPVFYIYGRARDQLAPTNDWTIDGNPTFWRLFESHRDPPRTGIIVFHPSNDHSGFIQSNQITLDVGGTFWLKVGLSNFQNDCNPDSDVGFRILIRGGNDPWIILEDQVVNFNDGWLDWSFDISSLAGQAVQVRVESYAGGTHQWCSEWACVDYIRIEDLQGQIFNPSSEFDSGWKTVVDTLSDGGYNPFFIMDFGGYGGQIEQFADYFLSFMDGIHTYNPVGTDFTELEDIYSRASAAAMGKNKLFVATVVPGYDDTAVRDPGFIVEREEGNYYRSMWATAKASDAGGFIITSFNEWHEGSEIEPSLEYSNQYLDITFLELGGILQAIPGSWWVLLPLLIIVLIISLLIYYFKFKRPRSPNK